MALLTRRSCLIVLAGLVVAAAAVRVRFLFVPVRPDEALTFLSYATRPWHDGISVYPLPNNHLLNTLAVHFSWRLFGQDEWTLRLPALVTGIATVPAAFLLGRELYDRVAGLWGAALVAGSSALVQYSTNGRGYMAGTLFVVLAAAAASWGVRTHRRAAWAGFAVCSVLAAYSVPSMAFGVLVIAAWIVCNAPTRRALLELAVALALVAVACVALYAPTFGDPGWSPPPDVVPRAHTLHEKWTLIQDVWGLFGTGLAPAVRLAILAAVIVALVMHRRIARHRVPLAGVAAVAALPVVFLWDPPVFARNWIELVPIYLVTAGAGFALLLRLALERVGLERRELQVGLALVMAAAIVPMAVLAVRGHEALVLDPPRADPGVVDLKQRALPHEPLLAGSTGGLCAAFYFRRDGVSGLVSRTPIPGYGGKLRRRPSGRVHVLAVNGEDDPERIVRQSGLTPRAGARPRLVRRYRYTSIYQVPLED